MGTPGKTVSYGSTAQFKVEAAKVLEQQVSVDELPQEEQAGVARLVDDAMAALGTTNRQATERIVPKAALRRRTLKRLLKARIAAGG